MSGLNWIRWIPDQPLQEMLGSGKLGETRLVCIKQITALLEKGSVDGKYGTEAERARYLAFDPISMARPSSRTSSTGTRRSPG